MDKQQQIKSLTWKYFRQQKFKELIMIPFIVLISGYFSARLMRWVDIITIPKFSSEPICEELAGLCWIIYAFIGAFYLILLSALLIGILWCFYKLIKSNWDKAEGRAKEEIKKNG